MRTPKRVIVAGSGDYHTNSTTALCRPRVTLDDGGYYVASPLQKAIYNEFSDYLQQLEDAKKRKGWPIYAIMNGELSDDLKHPSTQMITRNPQDAARNAIETLKPLVDMADKVIVTRGTAAHSGLASWSDEKIAEDFDAVQDKKGNYAHYQFRGIIGGVRWHVQHHGFSSYSQPHLALSAAKRNIDRVTANYSKIKQPYPDIVMFGHHHKPLDSGDMVQHTRVITLPSWQLTNEFGHRLGGDWLPIGGIIAYCDNGKLEIEKHYKHLVETRWQHV